MNKNPTKIETITNQVESESTKLIEIYNQITLYDTHYSTVRVGLVSLMLTIATASGGLFLESQPFAAIVMAFIFLSIGMLLNLHFYSLTKACYLMQRNLESGNPLQEKNNIPLNVLEIRKSMKELYKSDDWKLLSKIQEDMPTAIFVMFSAAWLMLLIVRVALK